MINAIFFVLSTGLAKIMPLVFGLYIAKALGHDSYVMFVVILTISNTLTAVSTISYTQLILICNESEVGIKSVEYAFKSVFFSLLVSIIGGFWSVNIDSRIVSCRDGFECGSNIVIYLIVGLYSLGVSIISTVMAQLNLKLDNKKAGLTSLVGFSLSYFLAFIISEISKNYTLVFFAISGCIFIYSILTFFVLNNDYLRCLNFSSIMQLVKKCLPLDANQIFIMIFVGCVLFSHSYSIARVASEGNSVISAVYVLGYQLFSIGLFIPGILGNIVIPRMFGLNGSDAINKTKLIGFYCLIAIIWILFVYINSGYILKYYGLEVTNDNIVIIMTLQGSVLLGSINAFFNQLLVSIKKFYFMALMSLFYFIVFYTWGAAMDFSGNNAAIGIALSYFIIVALSAIYLRKILS